MASNYCEETLYNGGCNDQHCPKDHNVRICELCRVICSPASNYDSHVQGKQHTQKLLELPEQPRFPSTRVRHCIVCAVSVPYEAWPEHIASESHWKQQQLATLRANYEQAEVDKQGVSVSHGATGVNLGVVSLEEAIRGVRAEVSVSTQSPSGIEVKRTNVRSRIPNHASFFAVAANTPSLTLVPGRPMVFTILFRNAHLGRYEARLEFLFQPAQGKVFMIARDIVVVVNSVQERQLLAPVAPFMRGRRAQWNDNEAVISASPMKSTMRWARDMPHFKVPPPLLELLKSRSPEEIRTRLTESYFPDPLSPANHAIYFENLLWIEETRAADDLRMYDMTGVEFEKNAKLYTLHIPGLAEKRPSVTIGDAILAQSEALHATFRGVVHDVRDEKVHVDFNAEFRAGQRYNVRFELNRTTLRRAHQALVAPISSPQRLLFPVLGFEGLDRPLGAEEGHGMMLVNSSLSSNAPQLLAVRSILNLKAGAAPFIVFGPPGTGKTVTIVEAIQQVLQRNPKARVLASAPSNSAADILALRLMVVLTADEMFRCNAAFRDPKSVPPKLAPYCRKLGNVYTIPSLAELTRFRVVVTTCNNASFAYNMGMPPGHFTHVFVDEAGQASEPEVLIAIKPLAHDTTRIILSGDPKQLGPVIRSHIAREFGFEKSYLERLMELPLYSGPHGRGTSYVKLVKNYRSHRSILTFPNERFYDGELEVCGAPQVINAFLSSPQLASPRFPLVFHAISGKNEREASSPSYFNIEEAVQVKAYVLALLGDRQFPIKPNEIGVITPYHAQVRKIRRLLLHENLGDVKVGSVEEFQGQERMAVIVSTVRSSADLLAYDAKFSLGFLSNARRFNVAMTRAQGLLVVVGDAAILSVDPLWRAFMNYVYLHDGWKGDEPTWDVDAPVQTDADYADELREAIAAEMNSVIEQQGPDEDIEAEANMESTEWEVQETTDW